MQLADRRITVMGLGWHGGGVAAARWLASQDARVTVTDLANPAALANSIAALANVPIAGWTLGRHDERDFQTADAIVVNPAVPPNQPLLIAARARRVRITSEIELFLQRSPAPVVGVTGSNGKSTTATMLAGIFAAAGRRVWLGGNIGVSLLDRLDEIATGDQIVLELSSFQLAHLSERAQFPAMAIVTNCTPNHLDWHGSMAAYVAAKRRLVERLPANGVAVLDPSQSETAGWQSATRARFVPAWPWERVPPLTVAGRHNLANAALAAAAAAAWGVIDREIAAGLAAFTGLPHRIEPAGQLDGRRLVDDSKSTTPEATLSALATCSGRVWLLLGGQAKGADFTILLGEVVRRAAGAACFGSCGPQLAVDLGRSGADFPVCAVEDLPAAIEWCRQMSAPGDTILLSPACASLDQFRDYEHRAQVFRALANEAGGGIANSPA